MNVSGVRRFVGCRDRTIGSNFGECRRAFFCSNGLDWSEKSITAPRQRLHKSRAVSGVVKSPAEPFHSRVKAMFKIHIGVSRPEPLAKLVARNQFAGAFEKADQNLNRLPLQPDFTALLPELPRTQVKLEEPESQRTGSWHRW